MCISSKSLKKIFAGKAECTETIADHNRKVAAWLENKYAFIRKKDSAWIIFNEIIHPFIPTLNYRKRFDP